MVMNVDTFNTPQILRPCQSESVPICHCHFASLDT